MPQDYHFTWLNSTLRIYTFEIGMRWEFEKNTLSHYWGRKKHFLVVWFFFSGITSAISESEERASLKRPFFYERAWVKFYLRTKCFIFDTILRNFISKFQSLHNLPPTLLSKHVSWKIPKNKRFPSQTSQIWILTFTIQRLPSSAFIAWEGWKNISCQITNVQSESDKK